MIFITTSNGVFCLDEAASAPEVVLRRQRGFFLFGKAALGFFGICRHTASGRILVSSRKSPGTGLRGKKARDTEIHAIEPGSLASEKLAVVHDVHDVHQMSVHGDVLHLTCTGRNRVVLYDLAGGRRLYSIDIGPDREDVNHVNAVCVDGERLLVGLNNRGHKDSELLELPLADLPPAAGPDLDGLGLGRIIRLEGLQHTHDILPWADGYLVCSSHEGKVYRTGDMAEVVTTGGWVRGLALGPEGLWVGNSPLAERSQRHREDLDGKVSLYDPQTFALIKTYALPGAGQVNDILSI